MPSLSSQSMIASLPWTELIPVNCAELISTSFSEWATNACPSVRSSGAAPSAGATTCRIGKSKAFAKS